MWKVPGKLSSGKRGYKQCSQRDNPSDLTSFSEEHDSSVTERYICWICQEEFDDEVNPIEHYDNRMQSTE